MRAILLSLMPKRKGSAKLQMLEPRTAMRISALCGPLSITVASVLSAIERAAPAIYLRNEQR